MRKPITVSVVLTAMFLSIISVVHAEDNCRGENLTKQKIPISMKIDGREGVQISMVLELCEKKYNERFSTFKKTRNSDSETVFVSGLEGFINNNFDRVYSHTYMPKNRSDNGENYEKRLKKYVKYAHKINGEYYSSAQILSKFYFGERRIFVYELPERSSKMLFYVVIKNDQQFQFDPFTGEDFGSVLMRSFKAKKKNPKRSKEYVSKEYDHKKRLTLEGKSHPVFLHYDGKSLDGKDIFQFSDEPVRSLHPALQIFNNANKALQEKDIKRYASYFTNNSKKEILSSLKTKSESWWTNKANTTVQQGKHVVYFVEADPICIVFYRKRNDEDGVVGKKVYHRYLLKTGKKEYKMTNINHIVPMDRFLTSKYFYSNVISNKNESD